MPIFVPFRVFLLIFLYSLLGIIGAVLVVYAIAWLIGYKINIPYAHILKFKSNEVKKTSEEVSRILKNGHKN